MYTITRFRIWLAQRAFGLRKQPLQPLETRPRFRPELAAMEDRLPPGDVLWSAIAGMRGMEAGPATPAALVRGLETPATKPAAGGRFQAALPELPAPAPSRRAPLPTPELPAVKPAELPGVGTVSVISFGSTSASESQLPQAAAPAGDGPALPSVGSTAPATFTVAPPAAEADAFNIGGPRVDGGNAAATPAPAETTDAITISSGETRRVPAAEAAAAGLPTTRGTEVGRTETVLPGRDEVSDIKGAGNAAKPDFAYQIPGTTVGLNVKPDRLAVQLTDETGAGLAALTEKGGALEGATFVRWVHNRELAVVEGPGLGAMVGTIADPAVAFTVPVYVDTAPGATEVVILNEVIVKLTDWQNAESFFKANGFASFHNLAGTFDTFVATIGEGYGEPVLDAVASLQGVAGVVYAEPNSYADVKKNYTPNDPDLLFGEMWHINNAGQSGGTVGADVHLIQAWDVNPGGSSGMVFADVDEGIEFTHEDLTPWVNPGETPFDGIDNDGNGWIDDINGWNFVNNNNVVTPIAGSFQDHGTATAGILAARGDNGIGVVSASYKGQVMAARIFEDSAATMENIASAIYYAAGKKADGSGTWTSARAMNNSWNGGPNTAALNDALTWATGTGHTGVGVPAFFAAGNFNGILIYPQTQAETTPGMIVVGASDNDDKWIDYSNPGAALDLLAPSSGNVLNIDTTDRTGADGYNPGGNYTGSGGTGFGGTSASSPMAASIAGLVLSQAASKSVTFSAAQIDAYLKQNAQLVDVATAEGYDPTTGLGFTQQHGAGRIDAFQAVDNVGKVEVGVHSVSANVVSGDTADFGTIDIGGKSTQTFRVLNQGTSTLNLAGLAITGANYTISAPLGDTSLALGESTTFSVDFSPTVTAAAVGKVTFTTNDASEGTFTINFTGTGKLVSIGGRTFDDWNGNGTLDVNDPGLEGRTVFLDTNNNGTLDTTPTDFFAAPGLVVPDNTTQTTTQTVSGLGGASVADVDLKLNITMTWDSDLIVNLISPAGTSVNMFSNVGGSGDNFVNTVLDDEATTPIAGGVAPFTGSFIPAAKLSAFDGQPAEGLWTLQLQDIAGGDVAVVNDWTLTISTGESSRTTDENGDYRFYTLPPATYTVRQIVPAGWTGTGPASQSVVVTATSSNTTTNFGSGFNNSFYTNVYDDVNSSGTKNAGELPMPAGQKVFLDENANGTYDVGGNATGSNTTPLVVPDGVGTFVFSDILISGATPGGVADVDVTLNITMTWDSDLDAFLISPSGGVTLLFSAVGGDGDNFTDTTLDDEAATNILDGAAPFTGSFQPMGFLSDLDGGLANGFWTLALADFAGGDIPTLQNWSVDIDLAEVSVLTNDLGNAFVDMPAGGPYTFQLVQPSGFNYTAPATGKYVVNATGVPMFNNYYGVVAASTGPAVASYTINNGAAQRSRVRSVEVSFNALVTITPGAFTFTRTGTYFGAPGDSKTISDGGAGPQVSVSTAINGSGFTVATLTFTGTGGVDGTSLADGVWAMKVDKSKVAIGAVTMTSDFVTTTAEGNFTTRIYRLFGDFNSDGSVDFLDKPAFDKTLNLGLGDPGYLAAADRNNDDSIDFLDKPAFDFNLNRTIDP